MALKDGTLLLVHDKESKRDWKLLSRRFKPWIVDVEIKELISQVTHAILNKESRRLGLDVVVTDEGVVLGGGTDHEGAEGG
jgi:hypothetical protein